MRAQLILVGTLVLAVSLACSRPEASDDQDPEAEGVEEAVQLLSAGVVCNGTEWEFSASASTSVSTLEAEPWLADNQYATVDLVYRGDGDWFLQASSNTIGADCSYTDQYVLFRGYADSGETDEMAAE